MILYNWDSLIDELLDISQEYEIIMLTKCIGYPTSSRSTCPSDAVDIGFRYIRDIVVDHIFESIDIDPTRSDICGNQYPSFLGLEILKCSLPIILRFVPMDRLSRHSLLHEEFCYFISPMLCFCEYEDIFDLWIFQNMYYERILVHTIDMIHMLSDRLSGRRYRCYLYLERITEHTMSEGRYSGSHRC